MPDPVRALLEDAVGLLREVGKAESWEGPYCAACGRSTGQGCYPNCPLVAVLARFDALPCRECQGIAWESASDSQAVRAVVLCPACRESTL